MHETGRLLDDSTLVAALGQTQSGWVNVKDAQQLDVRRTAAGGTYVFEIDWSNDGGTTTALTSTVVTAEARHVSVWVTAGWARVRVRNTHATAAFTTHRTQVFTQRPAKAR